MPDDSEADSDSQSSDPQDSSTNDSSEDSEGISITSADELGPPPQTESGGDSSADESAEEDDSPGGSTDDDSSTPDEPQDSADSGSDDATSLDAAAQDADNNLGDDSTDNSVVQCGANNTSPGNLNVTVLDSKTGQPVAGANVAITGPSASSDVADGSGMVKKNGIPPGSYTATASSNGYTSEQGAATVVSSATASITIKLIRITVTITLDKPVACPGHPLGLTATGTPGGGTFAWTINAPAADLVDGSNASAKSGPTLNLLGYKPDTATPKIPAQIAAIGVTYTYTNGQTATANQNVTIHEIKFVVTNDSIKKHPTTVEEAAGFVNITWATTGATMVTDPLIEIQLDPSCPRKTQCASNYRVGWLQTVRESVTNIRYTHTLIWSSVTSANHLLPARDADASAQAPFYFNTASFTGDRNKQTAHHEDSPGVKGPWIDPRPASPAPPPAKNKQLRQIDRSMTFTAWLVAQSVEWAAHDIPGSLAFLGNFDWSMGITVAVDTTKAVNSRATPKSQDPGVPNNISSGKGAGTPKLDGRTFNDLANDHANLHIDPAPEI